ncbi:unnamed protein product [Lactuca virosa]|uniref:Autophagy-related protein 18a n=1 Tax=Lactuca virosa TaxID=75947 RepID=A0AAU9M113_9ASTR|nr:unnamed protein product [Lactuca virosa]
MATVSSFSSPSWPNPSPNHHSDDHSSVVPTVDGSEDLSSLLPPIKTNPTQQQQSQYTHEEGDDNVRDWLNQFLPDNEVGIHDVNESSQDPDRVPVHDSTLIPHPHMEDPDFHEHASPPPPSALSLLHVSFNQDDGCFASGINHGFRIYNCDPFREIFRRDFENGGGIAIVEMLFRCNILALVGGGPEPQYPPNKTRPNHRGFGTEDIGLQKGQVRVEHYASKKTKFILAHDSRIACFTLAQDGHMIATASTKGTLIRIFDTHDGTLLQEVRRGADRAEIYSLAFSSTIQWLAVSSDKGTVHVFSLKPSQGSQGIIDKGKATTESSDQNHNNNTTPVSSSSSSLSFIKGVLPKYFSSEWSVAQFRLVEGCQYIVAFGHQKNTVVIIGMDGSFYRCKFDPTTGGEMTQLEYHNFVKPENSF